MATLIPMGCPSILCHPTQVGLISLSPGLPALSRRRLASSRVSLSSGSWVGTIASSGAPCSPGFLDGTIASSGAPCLPEFQSGTIASLGAPRSPGFRGGTVASSGAPRSLGFRGGTIASSGAPRSPEFQGGTIASLGAPRSPEFQGGTIASSGAPCSPGILGGTIASSGASSLPDNLDALALFGVSFIIRQQSAHCGLTKDPNFFGSLSRQVETSSCTFQMTFCPPGAWWNHLGLFCMKSSRRCTLLKAWFCTEGPTALCRNFSITFR